MSGDEDDNERDDVFDGGSDGDDGENEDDGDSGARDAFVLTPSSEASAPDGAPLVGGTALGPAAWRAMRHKRVANPDEPALPRPAQGPRGPRVGPSYYGSPGRLAIVQGQVYIVGVILVTQLWLVTTALFELLSGNRGVPLWWMALASGIGFAIALVVFLWPRRRSQGF